MTNEMQEYGAMQGGNFFRGGDFSVGAKLAFEVTDYEGVKSMPQQDGKEPRASPVYVVNVKGTRANGAKVANEAMKWRLNKPNAKVLSEQYDINSMKALVGKSLTLMIQSTSKGNTAAIIDCK